MSDPVVVDHLARVPRWMSSKGLNPGLEPLLEEEHGSLAIARTCCLNEGTRRALGNE
jgi:hypothetical protein